MCVQSTLPTSWSTKPHQSLDLASSGICILVSAAIYICPRSPGLSPRKTKTYSLVFPLAALGHGFVDSSSSPSTSPSLHLVLFVPKHQSHRLHSWRASKPVSALINSPPSRVNQSISQSDGSFVATGCTLVEAHSPHRSATPATAVFTHPGRN